jgi:hypothetical protein
MDEVWRHGGHTVKGARQVAWCRGAYAAVRGGLVPRRCTRGARWGCSSGVTMACRSEDVVVAHACVLQLRRELAAGSGSVTQT